MFLIDENVTSMMMLITAVNLKAASGKEVFQDENTFLHFRFYKKFMGRESVLHCSKRNFDHDVYHRAVNMGAARSKQVFPCGKEQFASFYKKFDLQKIHPDKKCSSSNKT